jgi:1,4-alpha-glucan branching enzyme
MPPRRHARRYAEGVTTHAPDGTGLITIDPWLAPYAGELRARYARYRNMLSRLTAHHANLASFATAHHHLGFTRGDHAGTPGTWYREWAPAAHALALIGDFNGWDRSAHPLARDEYGIWSRFFPDTPAGAAFPHDAPVKVYVRSDTGGADRLPAYIRRVTFNPDGTNATGRVWLPPAYKWKHPSPPRDHPPRIYEAHIGMAVEEERVGTFREFEQNILPRIVAAGYNCVQLMAIPEHPYYGSFGYHVSNFFAVSSRFGTPEEFKSLVDAAHGFGLRVLLDLVHSHSVKNTVEGLNRFDGTDHQYFHAGGRGEHPAWDSLLFDYSKWEVLRFLLSNVRYWLEEYRVDGFRFDGVTSMLYLDHGLGRAFTTYDDYFNAGVDNDAVTYLTLANQVAHEVKPDAITIAEDVSGMAGIARPVSEGGLGFDFRLAMGIPDYWIKVIKERRDEDWNIGDLYHTLTNRRTGEKHIAYAESHDQALVGDKTLAFRLMDAEMYWRMNKAGQSLSIDRGIALLKLTRLATFALGGEGWLNFMGNEFGHPEWIDFPREGNAYSYKHARRQWSLADNPFLRYQDIGAFDRALQALDSRRGILAAPAARLLSADEIGKRLVFERAGLIFAFNFHPSQSHTDWRVGAPEAADYRIILDTDHPRFGGQGLNPPEHVYPGQKVAWEGMPQSVQIYVPARSAQVLART